MSSPRPFLLGVAAVIAGAMPSAASAAPEFSAPITLAAPSPHVQGFPFVGVGSTGRVVAVWYQTVGRLPDLVARQGTIGGQFGPAQRVSPPTSPPTGGLPSLAVSRTGAALLWGTRQSHGPLRSIQVALAQGGRPFGKPRLIERVRSGGISGQIVARGDGYVVLWGANRVRKYAIVDADGHVGATRRLPDVPLGQAVVSPLGTLTIAGQTAAGGTVATNPQIAYAQMASPASTFGPVVTIRAAQAENGASDLLGQLVAGPGGTAVTWEELGRPAALRTAQLEPGGTPTPMTAFVADKLAPEATYGPPLEALPGDGLAPVAVWRIGQTKGVGIGPDVAGTVFAATQQPDGSYAAAQRLSSPRTIADLGAAVATRSDVVVTWGIQGVDRANVMYAVRAGNGTFSAPRSLVGDQHETRVANVAASSGGAVAVWNRQVQARLNHPAVNGVSLAVLRDGG